MFSLEKFHLNCMYIERLAIEETTRHVLLSPSFMLIFYARIHAKQVLLIQSG